MAKKNSSAKVFLKLALLALLAIGLNWNSASSGAAQSRQIRVVNASGVGGQTVNVAVELVAQGNENALGFSLNFPTAIFSNPSASIGNGAVGATLNVNTLQAANGRVGVAMALPTGQVFTAGVKQLVVVTFNVAANAPAGPTLITFGDVPVAREVSDANANSLTTVFTAGEVIVQQPNPAPTLTSLNPSSAIVGSNGISLMVNGANFVALSTVRWNGVTRTTQFVNSGQLTATIPASDLVNAGTASVDVVSPAPGGGTSNSLSFAINNPVPTINSLSPNSTTAGGGAFTLTVNGTGFLNSSTVWWNGSLRTTQFVNATQVTAPIQASDIASAGTASVVVQNPAPGGGSSPAATFTINNPVPTITSLSPNGVIAGSSAFTLTVNGTGFVNSSTVWWNGSLRTTQFVNATQVMASITAADVASAGTASVVVQNPAPGGGSSPGATFTITAATPAPTTTSIIPNIAVAGGTGFVLMVNGTNFANNSTVNWNGSGRTTTFVSATQLTAQILASDIATAGTAMVTVVTPAPGGGTSNAQTFTIASPVASVSAASFLGAELAPDSIVAAFGVNLATSVEIASSSPLPTTLAGTKVSVRDSAGTERLAPLFFVAPTQVNYLMPPGTANGIATVTVTSGDNKISIGSPVMASVAPGLFTANSSGQGVPAANIFRLKANGEQSTELLSRLDGATNQFVPIPIDLGPEGEQVFLILFGSGIKGNTGLSAVSVNIGGTDCEVLYAGETPGFFGLDQCNVRIPRSLGGRGDVDVVLTVNGKIANTVRINIK